MVSSALTASDELGLRARTSPTTEAVAAQATNPRGGSAGRDGLPQLACVVRRPHFRRG